MILMSYESSENFRFRRNSDAVLFLVSSKNDACKNAGHLLLFFAISEAH